jgi:hypothetical protein
MFKMFSTTTVLGLLILSAAQAQSGRPIQAKVPFAFTVQNTTLAAGNYQLTYNQTAHILSIQGLDRNSSAAFVTAEPVSPSERVNGPGGLVFDCYERSCLLSRVWQGAKSGAQGLKVMRSPREHRVAIAASVVSITIPVK